MKKEALYILMIFLLMPAALASDVSIWQGQYFTGTTFNTGTYDFNFTVYNAPIGGGRAILTQPL